MTALNEPGSAAAMADRAGSRRAGPHDNWRDSMSVSVPRIAVSLEGIRLTRSPSGECVVSIEIHGTWVDVIRDRGDVISHIVEPAGIESAIKCTPAG